MPRSCRIRRELGDVGRFAPSITSFTLVDAAMTDLAHTPAIEASLPDPSFLWWKAQLLRRFDAEREAAEPIDVGERVHVGAALLGAVVALSVVATVAWHELRDR